ncbi:hypothetical protein E2562_006772 [Oryza meyeriana var. granulata]|uniref:Uncharacterized protein n=1 Tax=Oryza meyeriana var. granulata TaxID=110450 RepID=A0A6G1C505_9ORYZ|nr:hypothetical protein E2562_006772 [Oryza meyeriana var. granulata]
MFQASNPLKPITALDNGGSGGVSKTAIDDRQGIWVKPHPGEEWLVEAREVDGEERVVVSRGQVGRMLRGRGVRELEQEGGGEGG